MSSSESNRRQFLQGESARRAAEQILFDAAGNPQLSAASSLAPTLEFHIEAMACRFAVFLNRHDASGGAEAAIDALEMVADLETQLTVYRDDSEVSNLNRRCADGPQKVESELFALLRRAKQISGDTGGAFDITSGPLGKVWGFHRREGRVPDADALNDTLKCIGANYLELDVPEESLAFAKAGVEINLGAIGKGYALDRVAEALAEKELESFLIHGGASSVLARGKRADRSAGWPLALRHPIRPRECVGLINLDGRSLGTSGSGNQFFRHQGKRLGHVLDPRTGWPVEGVWSATAFAESAADADALATAFFVLGPRKTAEYCQQHPEVSAVFVLPDAMDRRPNLELIGDPPFRPYQAE